MSDYKIQLELFEMEQAEKALEKLEREDFDVALAVDSYLEGNSVQDFMNNISEESYWKIWKFFKDY